MDDGLEIPEGLSLLAWEFGGEWDVIAKGYETLCYADNHGIVPKSSDIIIEYDKFEKEHMRHIVAASRLANQLHELGWKEVAIRPSGSKQSELLAHNISHDIGGES